MEPKKDDALFEQLGKNKKRRRRKVIVIVVTVILILAVLLVGLVIYLRRTVRERFASGADQVQSYEVKTGTLSTEARLLAAESPARKQGIYDPSASLGREETARASIFLPPSPKASDIISGRALT